MKMTSFRRFFYEEPLPPMDRVARFHGEEINKFRE